MSILTGKHVLVIGDETEQLTKIEAALVTYGSDIKAVTCQNADSSHIDEQHVGLILINHLHEGEHCNDTLVALRADQKTKQIPILALVPNNQTHIAQVLLLGASDYFLEHEDIHMVIDKIKQCLGDTESSEHHSVIDISEKTTSDQTGTRVFVVEDDSLLQNLLATKFEKSELEFEMVANGEQFEEKVMAFKPQIVILDLMLPGESGFDLLKKLKNNPATHDIPVLIFSNKDSQADRELAAELGAVGFYIKAMTDLSELLELIDRFKR